MAYKEIIYEKEGKLAIITINRPQAMNAFTNLTTSEMTEAVKDSAQDKNVRALILTGAGDRGFSAGADVGHLQRLARGEETVTQTIGGGDRLCEVLYNMEKPTFAAINGAVAGGSFGFILACDVRVASEKARFATIFISRSITPHMGTSWHLPRLLGEGRALELLLSRDIIDAKEAERIGLVSHVVPHDQLMPYTKAMAAKFAKGPPIAMTLTKREVRRAFANTLAMQMDYEGTCNGICHSTEDFKEAVAAMQEKREPEFKGR